MAFGKSVLAGLVAVAVSGAIVTGVSIAIAWWQIRKYLFSDGFYYITPEFHLRRILLASALIFAAGFWWQCRRTAR